MNEKETITSDEESDTEEIEIGDEEIGDEEIGDEENGDEENGDGDKEKGNKEIRVKIKGVKIKGVKEKGVKDKGVKDKGVKEKGDKEKRAIKRKREEKQNEILYMSDSDSEDTEEEVQLVEAPHAAKKEWIWLDSPPLDFFDGESDEDNENDVTKTMLLAMKHFLCPKLEMKHNLKNSDSFKTITGNFYLLCEMEKCGWEPDLPKSATLPQYALYHKIYDYIKEKNKGQKKTVEETDDSELLMN